MKDFDLSAAKRGEPIWMEAQHTGWAYAGPVFFVGVSENGIPVVEVRSKPSRVHPDYLRMAPQKKTVYVNLYKRGSLSEAAYHDTEAMAHLMTNGCEDLLVAVAVPVEIEV